MHQVQVQDVPQGDRKAAATYDPFQIPPNIELAMLHQRAKKVGFIDLERDYNSRQLCPCCNLPYEKTQIGLNEESKSFGFLGLGFPLFFQSTKMYIAVLFSILLVVGVHNIQATADQCYKGDINVLDRSKNKDGCYNFFGIAYTVNYTDKDLTIQAGLTLLSVFLTCISLYLIKHYQHQLARHTDDDELTASDYTIMMTNVRTDTTVVQIKEYFIKNFKIRQTSYNEHMVVHHERDPKIERILYASRIDDYVGWCREKVQLLTEQRKIFAGITTPQELRARNGELQNMVHEIQVIDAKLKLYEEQTQVHGDELNCPYVFVTFATESEMKMVLDLNRETFLENVLLGCCSWFDSCCFEHSSNFSKRYLNGKRIYLERSPEPLDICWENLAVSQTEKTKRYIVSVILSLLLIIYRKGAMILYLISYLQRSVEQNESYSAFALNYFLSFLCSLLIMSVNYLLTQLIRYTSQFEKHPTFTSEISSATLTLIIMQFINTALIPFALFVFTRDRFDQEDLMGSLFFIFLGHVLLVPLQVILDPLYYCWRIKKRREIVTQGFQSQYTQMDAHRYFEGPDFDITDKQTTVNNAILICTFYACIFPYGAAFEIISLILFYWASKYILIRRCAWPSNLSTMLQENIFKYDTIVLKRMMTVMPVLLAVGGLFYERLLIKETQNLSLHIINIIVGGVGMIILRFIKVGGETKVDIEAELQFQDQRLFWPVDYDRCNPVTRNRALAEWELMWKHKEGNGNMAQGMLLPRFMHRNLDILYGGNRPQIQMAQSQIVTHEQQAPLVPDQVNVQQNLQQQVLYVPGNDEADFERQNVMCASIFMQKQMKHRMKK